jgi:hypothetical protein
MMEWLQKIGIIYIAIICWVFITSEPVQAQLSLDVEIDETLANSQSVDIQSLIANNGQGPRLFQLYLQNENTSESANDLYFRILVESDRIGRIADIRQTYGQPFSLSPGQRVHATNNNIDKGLPGVEENFQFDGDLTQAGREFLNNLKGSTSLPSDRYQITVEIHQESVGGQPIVSTTAEIGANIVEDTHSFYLLSPGDVVGSNASISNSYPNFQWQGPNNTTYRLVVVEARGNESPQSLMEGAVSTEPIRSVGRSNNGSLVDYEMIDVIVKQSSFQYPNSGVQELEPGREYYWRVINQLETNSGVQTRESEIWSFSIVDSRKSRTAEQDSEISRALQKVFGEQFEQMQQDGLSFQSIVIEGQTYQGGQALQKLMELSRRAEQGDISIVIEEQ